MKLTSDQSDFLSRVRDGKLLKSADRAEDKVRQFCSRNGLAKVEMNPRRWVITEAGRAAIEESQP